MTRFYANTHLYKRLATIVDQIYHKRCAGSQSLRRTYTESFLTSKRMNSVLSSLTWGTWDEVEWALMTTTALEAEADDSAWCVPPSKFQRSGRKLRKKGLRAPRNSQLWFEELLECVESTSFGREKSIYHCNPLKCFHASEGSLSETVKCIPWADLPDGLHPRSGKLPAQRARNKQQQVDNLVVFLHHILR